MTAGNRHMWGGGNMPKLDYGAVVFCDIETRLKIPPDIICDNGYLPFRPVFNIAVFDPSHWTYGTDKYHGDPQEKAGGSWWGKYGNKTKLMRMLVRAMKEAKRVSNILAFKWCDAMIPLIRILPLFLGDFEVLNHRTELTKSGRKPKLTHWVVMKVRS